MGVNALGWGRVRASEFGVYCPAVHFVSLTRIWKSEISHWVPNYLDLLASLSMGLDGLYWFTSDWPPKPGNPREPSLAPIGPKGALISRYFWK